MGGVASCKTPAARRPRLRVLVLGLDAAGKTTVVHRLATGGYNGETVPTLECAMSRVDLDNFKLSLWDVGGQEALRVQWRNHYAATDVVLFVVDATDEARIGMAKKHLHEIIQEQALHTTPVLVLANKSDLPGALSGESVRKELQIEVLMEQGHTCDLVAISAVSGAGIDAVGEWIKTNAHDPEFE